MANYFRITGYNPNGDYCFIMDSNGKFEKLWQFSSYIIQKGCKVLEVSNDEKFIDGNIAKVPHNSDKMLIRASADGKPEHETKTVDGKNYSIVKVGDKYYIPDKNNL